MADSQHLPCEVPWLSSLGLVSKPFDWIVYTAEGGVFKTYLFHTSSPLSHKLLQVLKHQVIVAQGWESELLTRNLGILREALMQEEVHFKEGRGGGISRRKEKRKRKDQERVGKREEWWEKEVGERRRKEEKKNQIWLYGREPSLDIFFFLFFFELESFPWSHNLDPFPYIGVHKAMCWGREEAMKEERKRKNPFYIRECQCVLSQMQRK